MSVGEGRPLRIAVNTLCSTIGGGRTHLLRVLPLMFELGKRHTFTLYVAEEDAPEFRRLDAPNVRWETVRFRGIDAARRLAWENLALPFRLASSRQDVIFAPANLTHFLPGVPRVIVVHNVLPFYPDQWAGESLRSRTRLRLLAWATRHFVRRAEATIFLSRTGREDTLRGTAIVPRQEAIVYHGVDPEYGRIDPGLARERVRERWGIRGRYVLYASHFYRYKKIESLIRAIARLGSGASADLELVLAGTPFDAAYAAALREEAAQRGVTGRVRFLGGVPHGDLAVLHAGAAAIAFVSACENCPNLVLEALASGRPLVVSDRSVMPELVADAAIRVDPERIDELAAAIDRVTTDPGLARELGERGRARAADFRWPESAERILRVLERVGAGAPPMR